MRTTYEPPRSSIRRRRPGRGAGTGVGTLRGFVGSSSGTLLVEVEAIDLKKVTYDHEFEEVLLTWASTPGKFYVIQYLANDLCWREKSSTFAVSAETTWPVLPFGDKELYRVVEEE